ncbi:MAG: cytochrome PufQ [Pseudomonadota bacterium]
MKHKKEQSFEYRIYFALIYLAALPFALGKWMFRFVVPNATRANRNFFRRSFEQASSVTPMIFQSR